MTNKMVNAQGAVSVGPYKGYVGRAEYDADAETFHGEVIGIRDVITFQGRKVPELVKSFRDSVTDYLAFCESRKESPEKPASGKFIVRIPPELHREIANQASLNGQSLNDYVLGLLKGSTFDKVRPPRTAAKSNPAAKTNRLARVKSKRS